MLRVIIYNEKNQAIRDHKFWEGDIARNYVSDKMISLPDGYSIEVVKVPEELGNI